MDFSDAPNHKDEIVSEIRDDGFIEKILTMNSAKETRTIAD